MRTVCLILLALAASHLYAQDKTEVRVNVRTVDLPDSVTVFLTGSDPAIGSWHPTGLSMQRITKHEWQVAVDLLIGASIEYKFTLGSWGRQAARADGSIYSNFNFIVQPEVEITHDIPSWSTPERRQVVGQITGTVKYHRGMQGENLLPRDVIVWLPPNYETSKKKYPVLYMHDGQNLFDPATSSFGTDWSVDETLDRLIKSKSIPPMIVVGIYNTAERTLEYTPGEKGNAYMQFIVKELKPFIDQHYQTRPGREHTFVGGSSAGGMASFMLVWEYPEIFSKALCMSPAFRNPEGFTYAFNYIPNVIGAEKRENIKVYLDNGGIGLEAQLQPGIDEMIEALKKLSYQEGKEWVFVLDDKASHNEQAWAGRFPEAIRWLLK